MFPSVSDSIAPRARRPKTRALVGALALLALCACECDDSESTLGAACTTRDTCSADEVCRDRRCTSSHDATNLDGGPVDTDGSAIVDLSRITLSPDPTTLDLDIGVPSSALVYTVVGHRAGGATVNVGNATFATDHFAPGTIDASGRFFANGTIGGTVTVSASVPNGSTPLTASATLHVRLRATVGQGTGPTSPATVFMAAPVVDAAADAEILYPLDHAVMPQNVQPADVQWACGSGGALCPEADLFRVTLRKSDVTITRYVSNPAVAPNDHWLVEPAYWRALAQTNPDEDATIAVDRYEASTSRVVRGAPVSVRFARAAITGRVYYWDITTRTIRYIEDGTSTSHDLLPYSTSPQPGGQSDRCVGCHSISPSGRFMLANTSGANYGARYDLTRPELSTANPTPKEFPASTNIRWRLSTWSPDERRAMVTGADRDDYLILLDPVTGTPVQAKNAAGGDLALPDTATMPSWARDDTYIAFTAGNDSWAGDSHEGNLAILPIVDAALDRFGTATTLLASTSFDGRPEIGAGGTHGLFYPTTTPDSDWIAFASGTSSRSDPRDVDESWNAGDFAHTSALYLVRRDGTGLQRLGRGCATSAPEQNVGASGTTTRRGLDFQPNFSPFEGGGYYWLSFLSRRAYGNRQSGNLGHESGVQPGGIWIMAIRIAADGTTDPSEVPYWLPGQEPSHRAVSAYWAPRPCRGNGEGCSVGSECCGGDCRPPATGGAAVCSPPPPAMCRAQGQTCSTVVDCCGSVGDPMVVCSGRVCSYVLE